MNEQLVARKYARAFMRVFGKELESRFLERAQQLHAYLLEHKEALFYLKLSVISTSVKEHIMHRVLQRFELEEQLSKLMELLGKHKRLHMLLSVLEQIIQVYKNHNSIEEFLVTTAHPVPDAFLQELEQFLSNGTNSTVIMHRALDPHLIAGVRAVSDEHKWEYSVRDKLNHIRRFQ